MKYKTGDRVRSLVQFDTDQRICGDTECTDLPVGSLGTVTDTFAGGLGVLFDNDTHRLSCYVDFDEIEALS